MRPGAQMRVQPAPDQPDVPQEVYAINMTPRQVGQLLDELEHTRAKLNGIDVVRNHIKWIVGVLLVFTALMIAAFKISCVGST